MNHLPFRPEFEYAVRRGEKTKTARTKRYGNVGDVLTTPWADVKVRLLNVTQLALGVVAEQYYAEEGLDSPKEFIRIWTEIHPYSGYQPDKRVWLHTFEVVRTKRSVFDPAPPDQLKLM